MSEPNFSEPSFTRRAYQNAVEKKGTLATIATIVAIVAAIIGTYITLSNNLTIAKAARDEQMKGYAVQIGVLRSEVEGLKEDITRLTGWNKSLTERLNTQEKSFIEQESRSLQDRINRLEESAMGMKGKRK
jgi:VIT1/CCC1 family predicted Fe2+/Mn2+ transporter